MSIIKPNVRNRVTENGSNQAVSLALNVPSSEVLLLTGGSGLVDPTGEAAGYGGNLMTWEFNNTNTTTARRVRGYLVASGDAVAEDVKIIDEWIPANGILLYQPRVPRKYKSGATMRASQDTGTDVLSRVEALEFYIP